METLDNLLQKMSSRKRKRRVWARTPSGRGGLTYYLRAFFLVHFGYAYWTNAKEKNIRFYVHIDHPEFDQWVKRNVIERDRGLCYWCEKPLEPNEQTLDHLIPLSKKGPHIPENIVLSCPLCNEKRGNKMPTSLVPRGSLEIPDHLIVKKALETAK